MVRRDAAINRTEDLNVKVCEEATSCVIGSACICRKALATGRWRSQEQESRSWLKAISRHRDAAITHGGNDCRDDEGDRLAAALGARLPCRRGAQAPQAEARLEEGRRQPGLPDRERRQRQVRASPVQAPVAPERHAARQDRSGTAGPEVTRRRDRALARSRRRRASGPLAHRVRAASRPLTCPAICCFAFWLTGFRPISWVTWMPRASACSTARCLPRTPDSVPWS